MKAIFGMDEVGRGPLAGPVYACCVFAPNFYLKGVKDSKQLSFKARNEIYERLKKERIEWGIGRVYPLLIDKINILNATKLAMQRAVFNLEKKVGKPDLLLLDGNFKIDYDREQESIIKGDEKVFLISLASIIAKVERDKAMLNYHKQYPEYGFDKHKGYGTRYHFEKIKEYGCCKIHRQSFRLTKGC